MNNEISQGAKTSLAQLNERKAFDRLARDGAHSSDCIAATRPGVRRGKKTSSRPISPS